MGEGGGATGIGGRWVIKHQKPFSIQSLTLFSPQTVPFHYLSIHDFSLSSHAMTASYNKMPKKCEFDSSLKLK